MPVDRKGKGFIQENRISVPFFCRDYGGKAVVVARIIDGAKIACSANITIPVDRNNNGIADIWEIQEAEEWAEFHEIPPIDNPLHFFKIDQDIEVPAPPSLLHENPKDNPQNLIPNAEQMSRIPGQKEDVATKGDGLSLFYEYRGVIVDNGGFDVDLSGGKRGHVRLSPARREVLIFVDQTIFVFEKKINRSAASDSNGYCGKVIFTK